MDDVVEKIPKACEPCRKKKVRCDGKQPCHRCQRRPADCSYRQRARIRKSTQRASSAGVQPGLEDPKAVQPKERGSLVADQEQEPQEESGQAREQLYQSVAATHGNEADSVESSRLFYGPSSQFAFLQQLHREILCSGASQLPGDRADQEGGPGLDLFVERTLFFGTAQRIRASPLPSHTSLISSLPVQQAVEFLSGFKAATLPVVPLFSDQELDDLLSHFYSDGSDSPLSPQKRAITLVILAIGGLTTSHTDLADLLFIKAKQEAAVCDDVVSLSMIQLSVLLAEYQTYMGRPNSAYLNLGVACRKALAMGLHEENNISLVPSDILQKRRMTIWCLYFHESWQALALGRESALKKSDISASFPDNQPVLVGICKIAQIAEDGAKMIYGRRYDTLGQLYVAAEKMHTRLREFADQYAIGSAGMGNRNTGRGAVASLQLHNAYYHVILLTFRPFLIAESGLKRAGNHKESDVMWLRQACRYATDAAQDVIVYFTSSYRKDEACKLIRYNAFFLEAACVVLMYDMLRHPAKHTYNVEYIHMALQCLSSMTQDEPITVAEESIRQILRLVEDTIARKSQMSNPAGDQAALELSTRSTAEVESTEGQQSVYPSYQFPSLSTPVTHTAQQFIHFSGLPAPTGNGNLDRSTFATGSNPSYATPFGYPQNDVITTDLFNFFPVDLMSPYNTSSLESGDNHNT